MKRFDRNEVIAALSMVVGFGIIWHMWLLTGVAFARQADARAVVHAGGDLQVQGAGLAHLAVALAAGADVGGGDALERLTARIEQWMEMT